MQTFWTKGWSGSSLAFRKLVTQCYRAITFYDFPSLPSNRSKIIKKKTGQHADEISISRPRFSTGDYFTGNVSATRGPPRCDTPTCSQVKVVSVVRPLGWVIRAESCMQKRARQCIEPDDRCSCEARADNSTAPRSSAASCILGRIRLAFRVHQPGRPPSREAPSAMPNAARTRAATTRTAAARTLSIDMIMRIFVGSTIPFRPSIFSFLLAF